jgi:hypothetical protein
VQRKELKLGLSPGSQLVCRTGYTFSDNNYHFFRAAPRGALTNR